MDLSGKTEYSLMIYVAFFLAVNITGGAFLSDVGWAPYIQSSSSSAPSGATWIEGSSFRWADGSNEYWVSGSLGEAGTFTTSDGNWQTVNFNDNYASPVVVGTTNTRNGGDDAMVFEARNVQSGSAEMRVCENENAGGDGCDGHTSETVGYMVVDAQVAEAVPGIDAGRVSVSGEVNSNTETVSYSENFGSTPNVFVKTQTSNYRSPIHAIVTGTSTSSFTVGKCWQSSTDGCSSNGAETFGWVAIEPGNIPFQQQAETGSVSVSDSNWNSVSYSSFSSTPVAIVTTQTENGGQDAEIDEARNVGTGGMDVRFCEYEGGGECDNHNTETVGWLAISPGDLSINNAGGVSGNMWVEGNAVHWIDQNGNERAYTGTDTGSNVGNSGNIWIENSYIHYVDQNGNERSITP